jgi:hypothetical protein
MEINSLGNSYEDATLFEVILVLCSNSNIISEQRFWLKPWHYVLQEFWYISMPFNKIDLPESKFRITRSHLYDCRIFGIRQRRNIGWYRKNWQWRPCLPLACSIPVRCFHFQIKMHEEQDQRNQKYKGWWTRSSGQLQLQCSLTIYQNSGG